MYAGVYLLIGMMLAGTQFKNNVFGVFTNREKRTLEKLKIKDWSKDFKEEIRSLLCRYYSRFACHHFALPEVHN